ncbi:hypothetical protein E2L06_09765 [Haloterrigena sp. H1]|nr:hypothetical protein E2L06_09765 [Haloterrigena sp. H1]
MAPEELIEHVLVLHMAFLVVPTFPAFPALPAFPATFAFPAFLAGGIADNKWEGCTDRYFFLISLDGEYVRIDFVPNIIIGIWPPLAILVLVRDVESIRTLRHRFRALNIDYFGV